MTTRKVAAAKRPAAARKQPQDRKLSLRDQLAKKRAKVVEETFPLGEDGERAVAELEKLQGQLSILELMAHKDGKDSTALTELRKKITAAEKARDDACLTLRFRGLSEDERDALASEFATDDVPDSGDEDRDRVIEANAVKIKEWTYAAMAVCVQDSDLTADDWRDELSSGRWTAGDLVRIRLAIQSAYGAVPADGIPKG